MLKNSHSREASPEAISEQSEGELMDHRAKSRDETAKACDPSHTAI